jgi:DeoR family transcriptional regulator, aga operon transcriptional repressor
MPAKPQEKERAVSPMLIEERRQHVLATILREGRALVSELSDSLGISRITIRKDLDHLEARGLIQRTHGGALTSQRGTSLDRSIQEKQQVHLAEKQRIAIAAAKLVQDGQCVLLDSGTTTTAVARALRDLKRLTIITNALNIASELAGTDFDVILIGGTLRKNSSSLVGPLAEDTLREMHADILFLGVDGFDSTVGITTPNLLEARVNRAMMQASRKIVAVCGSSKFSHRSLAHIAPPTAIHTVITDTNIETADAEALRALGVELILAEG